MSAATCRRSNTVPLFLHSTQQRRLAGLAVYLVGTVLVGSHLYGDTGHTTIGGDSKLVAGDLAFTCLYGGFFALHPHVPTVGDAGILPTARPKTRRKPGRTQLPDTAEIPDLLQYRPIKAVMQYPTRTAVSVKPYSVRNFAAPALC